MSDLFVAQDPDVLRERSGRYYIDFVALQSEVTDARRTTR